MRRDERLYAFIISRTSRSRARIRRISIHQRWLKVAALTVAVLMSATLYGVYDLAQQAAERRMEQENNRLREENQKQRQQLDQLKNRVEAIEDTSRRLSEELSGGEQQQQEEEGTDLHGTGGPALDASTFSEIEFHAAHLEQDLKELESTLRVRARVPSIWPVEGETTDRFGMRSNPFGDEAPEFHAGQDIAAPRGTPVVAAADGVITLAGTQNGYGNVVYINHGNGFATRYGHLSRIDVSVGQEIRRGEILGAVGSTGRSTGPHLHYEVRVNEAAVNPRRYLPSY
jgi:murein DD-endopeptidase MepM/ murein hydrolase activator NlpD